MTRRQLIILTVVALVIGIITVLVQREQGTEHAPQARTRLYPGLESRLNEVARIIVISDQGAALHIERDGQVWRIKEREGYPADLSRIRETLIKLARLDRIEPKTRDPHRYARLGVRDPDQPDSEGTEIQLRDAQGTLMADLIIGTRAEPRGGYVRQKGEEQSWLTSEHIGLALQPQDWLDKGLLRIPLNRIARVQRHPPQGQAFAIVRKSGKDATDELILEPLPGGRRPRPRELRRLASALGNLRLNDVHPADQTSSDSAPWDLTTYTTREGVIIEARTRTLDNKASLRLAVRLEQPVGPDSKDSDQARQEVTHLRQRFDGWTYEIPGYKGTSLTLGLEAVSEPEQPQAKTGPAPPSAPPPESAAEPPAPQSSSPPSSSETTTHPASEAPAKLESAAPGPGVDQPGVQATSPAPHTASPAQTTAPTPQ